MRTTFLLLCLVLLLSVTTPAQAQFRSDAPEQSAPARVYDESSFQAVFDRLFSPEHFRMAHSYEMSFSSFGGESASMGMYTNSMMWQFNPKLAARVDVSLMQPFSGDLFGQSQNPRLFLRNAEIAYRPSERMQFHFQVRQSPYGGYLGPYGSYYNPYRASSVNMRVGTQSRDLFWKDDAQR